MRIQGPGNCAKALLDDLVGKSLGVSFGLEFAGGASATALPVSDPMSPLICGPITGIRSSVEFRSWR